jgi:hypothetical protein
MVKPKVKLSGQNGNVFNLIAICKCALRMSNLSALADEMSKRCTSAKSYDEALAIMMEYCEVS